MPPYSRVCPFCCSGDYCTPGTLHHDTPTPYLNLMRGYLDELLALPPLTPWRMAYSLIRNKNYDPYHTQVLEIVESFEVVEVVVNLYFADSQDVCDAMELMKSMLYAEVDRRRWRSGR